MKVNVLKRLIKEDFKQEEQELIGKIGTILNPALETVTRALTQSLTFDDNFLSQTKEITLTVSEKGIPVAPTTFQFTLKGVCRSMLVLRAINQTNSSAFVSGAPFVSWSQNNTTIKIEHITGLIAGNKYTIRLIALI